MIRVLVWLAGCVALIYAIDRYGYWHEAIAFAVLTAAMLWIVGGACMLGGKRGQPAQRGDSRAAVAAAMRERAQAAAAAQAERESR